MRTRKSKYGAVKTTVDGIVFQSKREAKRFGDLTLMLKAGVITDLRIQVPFPIAVNGKKIADYLADFVYTENGKQVVEDCKGFRTPVYRLKKKLVEAIHGITIKET